MRKMQTVFLAVASLIGMTLFANSAQAQVEAAEIYCTIRDTGTSLNCQWVGKDNRKSMSADEIAQFIDKAEVAAYMSVKSRRGHERVFFVDAESPQFRKLSEVKKTGSISEISKAKNDLFSEVEKKTIKISDDLDAMNPSMELVKYDASVGVDKFKRELRRLDNELVTVRGTNPNRAYEDGSTTAEAGGAAKWTLAAGLGYNTVIGIAGLANSANSADQTIGSFSGNIYATHAWGPLWSNELEIRSLVAADYGRSQSTTIYPKVNSTNMYANLKTYRNFGDYDLGIHIVQNSFVTANARIATGYTVDPAQFVGIAYKRDFKLGKWSMDFAIAYDIATTMPSATATNNTKGAATAGSLIDFEFNIENQISRTSAVVVQLNSEMMSLTYPTGTAAIPVVPTGQAIQNNTTTGFAAFYKYSWY